MDEIGFQDAIDEPGNAALEVAWPKPVLERGVEARDVSELDAAGLGVDLVAGLGVGLIIQRLVGQDDATKRVPGPRAGLYAGGQKPEGIAFIIIPGRQLAAGERCDAEASPAEVTLEDRVTAEQAASPRPRALRARRTPFSMSSRRLST